jgi:hypothetical protein
MTAPYEEILAGETWLRLPPGPRHEAICARLHTRVGIALGDTAGLRLLEPRTVVQVRAGTLLRPDLALVDAANGRLWLAAEIIHTGDHHVDTVTKKTIYEDVRVPRLWMVDPRYDNVELYATGSFGLALKGILAGLEVLRDDRIPGLDLTIRDLFQG